jgi:hypothetical protein
VVSELSPLPEARRRAYLDAIGIGLYAARKPLANALASWLPAMPERTEEPSASGGVLLAAHDTAPSPATDRALAPAEARRDAPSRVLDAPAVVVRQAPSVPAGLPLQAAGVQGSDLRFPVAVAVFEWTGRYRVLVQLRDGDAPSLDSREHPLWNDLALALSPGGAPAFGSLPLFRFPPGRHHRHLATPEHLADALHSLMQSRQSRVPVPAVLVFADAPVRACLGGSGDIVLLPSLREMLEDWTLKRPAWALMRAVIRH